MNKPGLILPQKQETNAVKRGRAILREIMIKTAETVDKGKNPSKIIISRALADDIGAFFYFATKWDGKLPTDLYGLPIEYEPGTDRKVRIMTSPAPVQRVDVDPDETKPVSELLGRV